MFYRKLYKYPYSYEFILRNSEVKMYVKRCLEDKIRKYLKDKEIIAIIGSRQCGKTTLMKEIYRNLKNAKFLSFEDRDILELFNNHIKEFIEKYVKETDYLFIDEFQYAKNGGKQLKFIYDSENIKILISGSSAVELSIHSIKYLVGRIYVFTLNPFSFEEFLKYKDEKLYHLYEKPQISKVSIKLINKYYGEYLIYGGYPRVVLENDFEKKKEILKNIYNTYLLKEIKEILQISDDQKINTIIKALALQTGNVINFNELSSFTNIEFHQLKKYIEILKKTFVGFLIKPYFTNKRKELVKTPKFYFLDLGFRNIAINNFLEINSRTDIGALNENFVASEMIKKDIELKFWRTKAGAEVDFILELEAQLIPIEVKTNLKEENVTRSFRNFIEVYKSKQGFILSLDFIGEKKINGSNIIFSPLFQVSMRVK